MMSAFAWPDSSCLTCLRWNTYPESMCPGSRCMHIDHRLRRRPWTYAVSQTHRRQAAETRDFGAASALNPFKNKYFCATQYTWNEWVASTPQNNLWVLRRKVLQVQSIRNFSTWNTRWSDWLRLGLQRIQFITLLSAMCTAVIQSSCNATFAWME